VIQSTLLLSLKRCQSDLTLYWQKKQLWHVYCIAHFVVLQYAVMVIWYYSEHDTVFDHLRHDKEIPNKNIYFQKMKVYLLLLDQPPMMKQFSVLLG